MYALTESKVVSLHNYFIVGVDIDVVFNRFVDRSWERLGVD